VNWRSRYTNTRNKISSFPGSASAKLAHTSRQHNHHLRDRAEAAHVENFPYVAIEETVINAIYHRSYQEREPVEVRIGVDEMIILSYPGPDRSVRLDELRAGRANPRRYRNRRIGEFLKELDLTEGRCTGIPKIIKAMRENGSPPPVFESMRTTVTSWCGYRCIHWLAHQ
jgi:predicted HTH transcriptional regulator